jgi:hypothetical protein
MSDLRSRISDVLFYQFGVKHEQSNLMADAVIRELGLEVERGGTYEVGGKASSCRYVTDWMTDG